MQRTRKYYFLKAKPLPSFFSSFFFSCQLRRAVHSGIQLLLPQQLGSTPGAALSSMHLQEVAERCFYLEQLNPADRSRGRESSQAPGSLPACCSVTLGKSPRCSGSSLISSSCPSPLLNTRAVSLSRVQAPAAAPLPAHTRADKRCHRNPG